jgi:c-di-GMP-binding flagellar brake protein YcgR
MSLQFNLSELEEAISDIFMPEARIEVAFNIDSELPIVLPTNIYKCDYESKRMLIYQTRPEILPSFKYDTMDLTALFEKELGRMLRVGLRCRSEKFLNSYKINEQVRENLVLVQYFQPMRKVNLRFAYRLRTSYRYNVQAVIQKDDTAYESGSWFTVQDISVTGIGLQVPKMIGKKENPLLNIPMNTRLDIRITLETDDSKGQPYQISTEIGITRKVMSYNVKSGFLGGRFTALAPEHQETLFQYIHAAQRYEIRNIKGR